MEITTRLAHLTTPTEALAATREQAPSGSVWLLASSYRCPKLPWLSVGERKATPSDLQVVRQRVNAEEQRSPDSSHGAHPGSPSGTWPPRADSVPPGPGLPGLEAGHRTVLLCASRRSHKSTWAL